MDIRLRGKTPIVVGGTGLYIKALVDGLATLPPADEAIRAELLAKAQCHGREKLHEELTRVDPVSARKIPPTNIQRLIRALEVYLLTGRPISEWHRKTRRPTNETFAMIGLSWPRTLLHKNIEKRSHDILPGMIREARTILKKGYSEDCPALQSLGYREALAYLRGGITKNELLERLNRSTRQFAKRQMTWFRGDPRIRWIPCGSGFKASQIAQETLKLIRTY